VSCQNPGGAPPSPLQIDIDRCITSEVTKVIIITIHEVKFIKPSAYFSQFQCLFVGKLQGMEFNGCMTLKLKLTSSSVKGHQDQII
jgi:hypothetical protein